MQILYSLSLSRSLKNPTGKKKKAKKIIWKMKSGDKCERTTEKRKKRDHKIREHSTTKWILRWNPISLSFYFFRLLWLQRAAFATSRNSDSAAAATQCTCLSHTHTSTSPTKCVRNDTDFMRDRMWPTNKMNSIVKKRPVVDVPHQTALGSRRKEQNK